MFFPIKVFVFRYCNIKFDTKRISFLLQHYLCMANMPNECDTCDQKIKHAIAFLILENSVTTFFIEFYMIY